MFALRVKDHHLEEKQPVVKEFKVSGKMMMEMRELERFGRRKRDAEIIESRTRKDLINPEDKRIRDRLNRMKKVVSHEKRKKSNAAARGNKKASADRREEPQR